MNLQVQISSNINVLLYKIRSLLTRINVSFSVLIIIRKYSNYTNLFWQMERAFYYDI